MPDQEQHTPGPEDAVAMALLGGQALKTAEREAAEAIWASEIIREVGKCAVRATNQKTGMEFANGVRVPETMHEYCLPNVTVCYNVSHDHDGVFIIDLVVRYWVDSWRVDCRVEPDHLPHGVVFIIEQEAKDAHAEAVIDARMPF